MSPTTAAVSGERTPTATSAAPIEAYLHAVASAAHRAVPRRPCAKVRPHGAHAAMGEEAAAARTAGATTSHRVANSCDSGAGDEQGQRDAAHPADAEQRDGRALRGTLAAERRAKSPIRTAAACPRRRDRVQECADPVAHAMRRCVRPTRRSAPNARRQHSADATSIATCSSAAAATGRRSGAAQTRERLVCVGRERPCERAGEEQQRDAGGGVRAKRSM
jgi:hypothetical protein